MVPAMFKWLLSFAFFMIPVEHVLASRIFPLDNIPVHPLYVSITEMNHNSREKALEITIKLFADDFESALKSRHNAVVDLSNSKMHKQFEPWVQEYIRAHLQLKLNSRPVNLEFVGFEKDKEAIWCYAQVNEVTKVGRIEVRNTLLYEMFDTQINIMHINANGTRKSTKLNRPADTAIFDF
jgi:hypothetical protein